MALLSNGLYRVTLKDNLGALLKGFSFNVAGDSTGGPSSEQMRCAFYMATKIHPLENNTHGYYSNLVPGNYHWDFEKITEFGDPLCQQQLKAQYEIIRSGVLRNNPSQQGGGDNQGRGEAKQTRVQDAGEQDASTNQGAESNKGGGLLGRLFGGGRGNQGGGKGGGLLGKLAGGVAVAAIGGALLGGSKGKGSSSSSGALSGLGKKGNGLFGGSSSGSSKKSGGGLLGGSLSSSKKNSGGGLLGGSSSSSKKKSGGGLLGGSSSSSKKSGGSVLGGGAKKSGLGGGKKRR